MAALPGTPVGFALQSRLQRSSPAAHSTSELGVFSEPPKKRPPSASIGRAAASASVHSRSKPHHRSALVEAANRGPLSFEVSPPPPQSTAVAPEEWTFYELAGQRQAVVITGAAESRPNYRVFPSTRPSSRSDVLQLSKTLDHMLADAGTSSGEALRSLDMAFEELVRQTFVECAERGELLGRVRRGYDYYLSALVERVRFIEGTDRESRLRQVETELAQFKKRSTDAESKMTRLNVVSMLRTASAEVHGERKAEAKADKAKAKEEAKAGAFSDQAVKAFEQCTPGDQQSAFKQMIVQTNATGKMQLLRTMWKLFPEGKRPEIVRTLTSELPPEAQVRFSGDLASALTFEERVGIVQRLLREFSAFEMSSFVDFLPYIWDDLAVQFASKLLARMSAADRTRIASQLQKETDAAAVARALAQVDDSAQPAASAAQEEKVDLSCDPSQLLPDELPGWQSLRAASSSSASYDLARVHALSAECLEAALADLSPDGRLAPVRSATLNGATGAAAFPRLVLNVLLRHVTPPTPQQKSGAEHFTPMLQQAREALWTLLTSLRSHAKSSARAKLFARLCGVLKCEYDARRTDLALQLLASLAAKPGDVRELMHALANGDGLLPMQGLSEGAPCLPVALKQFETDLGGLQRVNVLAEKLMGIAVNDPRSKPQAALVIDCDTALLHVLDAYDSARQRLGAALTILHDQIEVQRASGTLDAHVFNAALCAFDASLTEGATAALYVDLDLAAHEEHAQASAGSEGATRGSETTPLRLFVAVCEAHGVTNVAKSVGTAAYT